MATRPELCTTTISSMNPANINATGSTIADGTRSQAIGRRPFAHLSRLLDGIVTVAEDVAPRVAPAASLSVRLNVGGTTETVDVTTDAEAVDTAIGRWDGEETARRLELLLGPDLQFIRINGTLVGGLAGIVIHALAGLL